MSCIHGIVATATASDRIFNWLKLGSKYVAYKLIIIDYKLIIVTVIIANLKLA